MTAGSPTKRKDREGERYESIDFIVQCALKKGTLVHSTYPRLDLGTAVTMIRAPLLALALSLAVATCLLGGVRGATEFKKILKVGLIRLNL